MLKEALYSVSWIGPMKGVKEVHAMIRNYITTAIRNLFKHKGYTLVNVIGLALGRSRPPDHPSLRWTHREQSGVRSGSHSIRRGPGLHLVLSILST